MPRSSRATARPASVAVTATAMLARTRLRPVPEINIGSPCGCGRPGESRSDEHLLTAETAPSARSGPTGETADAPLTRSRQDELRHGMFENFHHVVRFPADPEGSAVFAEQILAG